MNYNTPEKMEQLEAYRRRERRLLREVRFFVKETVDEIEDVQIYFEWPYPCAGWREEALLGLQQDLEQRGVPWLSCRIDGCNYGMKNATGDAFLRKKWMVKTTDELFHKNFRAKVCPGNHVHAVIEGQETEKSAYYPWKLVQAITRHWKAQHVPGRHLQMLLSRESVQDSDEDDEKDVLVSRIPRPVAELNSEFEAKIALGEQDFSFQRCEAILVLMQGAKTSRGPMRSRGSQAGVTYQMYGAYSHGGLHGITKHTWQHPWTCRYLNAFLKSRVPNQTWTSIMIGYNQRTQPHRDVHNLKESVNILVGVGAYAGGELWLHGEAPPGVPKVSRWHGGQLWSGYELSTRNQVVIFDPDQWHATQAWTGYRITISAFTTRSIPHWDAQELKDLRALAFPLTGGNLYPLESHGDPLESRGDPLESRGDPLESRGDPSESRGDEVPKLLDGGPVPKAELERWTAKVAKFHKAAGHPSNKNLGRIVQEAGHPQWKIDVAKRYHCPACASLKQGGTSSGQIPPAATHQQYEAWEAVGVDAGEWVPPGSKKKVKFILMVDLATKLRVIQPIMIYDLLQMKNESGSDLIKAVSERWLSTFPKPRILVLDSAKPYVSEQVHAFASAINVGLHYTAEKESWAHGAVEASVQDVKSTASAIYLENMDQDLEVTLHLAVAALNSTEYTAGFSAFQWAYGRNYNITDEDVRTFQHVDPKIDFAQLVVARQRAEEVARQTRARRVLSKLGNTSVRQPLRNYEPLDLVKVWRRVWPQEQCKGPRGGYKKSGRPHWIGPGRVVFSEVLPHQKESGGKRHILWVLVGNQLLRCSAHSVRPVTEVERFQYETSGAENPSMWKSLADIVPKREYYDVVDEEPGENEVEMPRLPEAPDDTTTVVPIRRARRKVTFQPGDYVAKPVGERLMVDDGEDEEPTTTATTTSSSSTKHVGDVNDYELPEPKRARSTTDNGGSDAAGENWVEQLMLEAKQEEEMDLFNVMDNVEEFLRIEFDLENHMSNRQKKMMERNPVAFMVKKMRDCEVNISRLPEHERPLFSRAKAKEVDSFLKNEAVRKCLDDEEIKKAYESSRIVKARWVLTWKLVPPEDRQEALDDSQKNLATLHTKDGARKAKARIVLLGFQHPSLLDPSLKTASPVQSSLGRNLLYTMAAHHQWELEGLDLATAFLQTQPTEADQELWTTGVEELRQALDVGAEGIMRIFRNIYGSTTAPRGLWLALHKRLTELGAQPVLGERCLWVWLSKTDMDEDHPKVIGSMGGHVDDFHRIGDGTSAEWCEIKEKINNAYKWGMTKKNSYRHAGTDVTTVKDKNGFNKIVVDQSYYIESIQDIEIEPDRLRQNGPLERREVEACRTTLGALQWVAIQTQPQLTARCNLLLTEVVTSGTLETAREIQMMVGEVRQNPVKLEFKKFPQAKHWTEVVFISMGDQAHNNRPKGDSTGGLVTLAAGPECLSGQVCEMSLLAWRSWKLKRKAIGSNDAEVQSILEAEDHNFRTRLLWSELHGAGGLQHRRELRRDLVELTEKQVLKVKGVLCTDSRGGYDAVELNESPLLGLSNMRSALQAFQLRDNLSRAGCELRWLASDYDLADALTKKRMDSRVGLLKFLRTGVWSIKFDPDFTAAKKGKKIGKSAVDAVDKHLFGDPNDHWLSASDSFLGWCNMYSFNQMHTPSPYAASGLRGPS